MEFYFGDNILLIGIQSYVSYQYLLQMLISNGILCISLKKFFLIYYLFIMFIFGCVGSLLLCEGFLQLRRVGATLHRGARASHYRGLSCCGAEAPDTQAQ